VTSKEADLAITDLTITAERNDAVEFTSPFMNLGKRRHSQCHYQKAHKSFEDLKTDSRLYQTAFQV
jgi:ABC-type amino acid transport substrate-binding protein